MTARLALIGVLGAVAAAGGGFTFGRHVEATAQHARAADKTIGEMGALLDANRQLIVDAQSASQDMREALTARAAQDQKSTRELRNALGQTASSRADCSFDDGVMRLIEAARERAAAGAAGGVRGAVPATTGPGEP